MRANEFTSKPKEKTDEFVQALAPIAGAIGRGAVAGAQALGRGAMAAGRAVGSGVSKVGQAMGQTVGNITAAGQQQQPTPQDIAQAKKDQETMANNLGQLKSLGIDVNPQMAKQALTKADAGMALSPNDKDMISKIAPAVGDIISNPQLGGQFKDLIKKSMASKV